MIEFIKYVYGEQVWLQIQTRTQVLNNNSIQLNSFTII
jgi:hypothetical protein